MTLHELIELEANNQWLFVGILGAFPVLTLILGLMAGKKAATSPFKYLFSGLVYLCSIPGMLAMAACLHLFFIDDGDFMKVNLVVYFLPIVSMVVTLTLMNRFVPLSKVPGFGRISGFLMVAGIVGLVLFFLQRTFIGVIFFGSIWTLLGLFGVLVVIFTVGSQMLFGKKER